MPKALVVFFFVLLELAACGVCYLLYYDHWGYALLLTFIVSMFDRVNLIVDAGWLIFIIHKIIS